MPLLYAAVVVFGTIRMLFWMRMAIESSNIFYVMLSFWGLVGWAVFVWWFTEFSSRPEEEKRIGE